MTNNYICNPTMGLDRLDKKAYDKAEMITSKWEPVSKDKVHKLFPEGFCGNVRPRFNIQSGRFGFSFPDEWKDKNYCGIYRVISSALLFYRLFCLWAFPWNVCDGEGGDRYKCIWWLNLKHKETGEILQFGEWKGAAGIWTRFHQHEELPAAYKKDMLELLNFIVSNEVPHPYDGCVAGSVA